MNWRRLGLSCIKCCQWNRLSPKLRHKRIIFLLRKGKRGHRANSKSLSVTISMQKLRKASFLWISPKPNFNLSWMKCKLMKAKTICWGSCGFYCKFAKDSWSAYRHFWSSEPIWQLSTTISLPTHPKPTENLSCYWTPYSFVSLRSISISISTINTWKSISGWKYPPQLIVFLRSTSQERESSF